MIYCVNDGAVMANWNQVLLEKFGKPNDLVTFMGDPTGEFTKACGMEMTDPGPVSKGLVGRCKRFAMHVVNNVVQYVAVSESDCDPAGDDDPDATCGPAMIEAIKVCLEEAKAREMVNNEEMSKEYN